MCLKDTKSMLSITSPDGKRCVNRGIKRNHFCYYNANYISSKLSHITMALKSPKIGKTKVAAGKQKLLNLSIALIQAQQPVFKKNFNILLEKTHSGYYAVFELRETLLFHEWLIESGFKRFTDTFSKPSVSCQFHLFIFFLSYFYSVKDLATLSLCLKIIFWIPLIKIQ